MEYRLHQRLALIEAALLRHHPDYIILMDGYNDVIGLSSATPNYDAYAATPHSYEFNLLANPGSARSLLFFTTTWLKANSEFFGSLTDRLQRGFRTARRQRLEIRNEVETPVRLADLTPSEQSQFAISQTQVSHYAHVARQIHCILDLEGAKAISLLQAVLILSHKPFTDSERRMFSHNLRINGPLLTALFGSIRRYLLPPCTS